MTSPGRHAVRALILAAGEGTRLRPLTLEKPKCLVSLAGRTLLDRQLSALRAGGISDIGIVAGYRADQIRQAAPESRVFLNEAFRDTNMVASLFAAREWLEQPTDLLVVYGDIVFEPAVLTTIVAADGDVSVVVDDQWRRYWQLRMSDPLSDAETLRIDRGRIVEIGEKASDYAAIESQYIGMIKIAGGVLPRVLEMYDNLDRTVPYRGRPFDRMHLTDFLQHLIDAGVKVEPVHISNGWLEVDALSDHQLYERLHRDGTLRTFCALQ